LGYAGVPYIGHSERLSAAEHSVPDSPALRPGDAALNEMNLTANAGTRPAIETYEVAVDLRL
jgi:hypothetical protein